MLDCTLTISACSYRGLQRQLGEVFHEGAPYQASIETILEKALEKLGPVNKPTICFSSRYVKLKKPVSSIHLIDIIAQVFFSFHKYNYSLSFLSFRTDQGVHAICNIAHVDLQRHTGSYTPKTIHKTLNSYMQKSDICLIVRGVEAVPEFFGARHCTASRHYLYRIGVTQSKIVPITEWRKCWFLEEPFCDEKAAKACQLFVGTHDLSAFCHRVAHVPSGYRKTRTLDKFDIHEGRPLFDPAYDPLYQGIRFFDFHVLGKSFMYRQVRRMVSTVVNYARNRLSWDEVCQLFEPPYQWNTKAAVAPPHGLFLISANLKAASINQDGQLQRPTTNLVVEVSDDTSNSTQR